MTATIVVRELYDTFEQIGGVLPDCESRVRNADYSATLSEMLPTIAAGEVLAFASETLPGGEQWATLAPSTLRRKGHRKILFETGSLKESLVNMGGSGNINGVASRGLVFGTEMAYATFHQAGTLRMPVRPAIGVSEETVGKIANAIADATVEKMK